MPGPFGFSNAFTSGEVDEHVYDRTDLQQTAKGCAEALNLLIQIPGPLDKRPGFWLVGPVNDQANNTRMVAFRKSWTDACLLEFGAGVAHVWNLNGTPAIDPGTGAQIAFSTAFTSAQLPLLRWKQVQDVIYFRTSDGSLQPTALARYNFGVAAGDWVFTTTSFPNGPWLAENTNQGFTINLNNSGTDLIDRNFAATGAGAIPAGATVGIVASAALFDPAQVGSQLRVRENGDAQSVAAWEPATNYLPPNTGSDGYFVSSNGRVYNCTRGGTVKLGSNPPVCLQGTQSDGDNMWAYLHDGAGIVRIDSVSDSTHANGTVLRTCPIYSGVNTFCWAFSAYSPLDGWPTAWPEIREERFVDGACSGNQDWVDLSETAGFTPTSEDFTPGTGLGVITDDDAVRRRVGAKGGKIQWFRVATYLLVGTETGEHLISGPVLDEPISPQGVVIKDLSAFGCAPIEPENVQSGLLFVTMTQRTLREITIATSQEPTGEDHTVLARHIADRVFEQIKWTKAPLNNLWCRMADKGLACFTYHVEQQVKGFTSQQIADGTFALLDMQVLPNENGYEIPWVVVQSPIYGKLILRLSDPTQGLYMDSAVSWSGSSSNTIPVPAMWNGQMVDVLAEVDQGSRAGSGGTPSHAAGFDFYVTPVWPWQGHPVVNWTAPAVLPDHFRVYVQSVPPGPTVATPNWTLSNDVSGPAGLDASARSFDLQGMIMVDGSANFVWVVGFNATETQANSIFPVQFSGNSGTFAGTITSTWTGANTAFFCSLPWTLNCPHGGEFQGQMTFNIPSVQSGQTPNTATATAAWLNYDTLADQQGSTRKYVAVAGIAGPAGDVFNIPYSETSIVNSAPNLAANGHIISPQTSPMVGEATMNVGATPPWDIVLNVSLDLAAQYVSPQAQNGYGGAGGGGGGAGVQAPGKAVTAQQWFKQLPVAGGEVTLPGGATAEGAIVGFTYPVFFRSLKLDLKNLWGGALLQTQRITEALVDLKTVLATIGGDNANWPGEDVSARLAADVPGAVARRFVRRVTIVQDEGAESDDHDPRITISERSPYPFTLYAIRQDKVAIGE
jgi:hypothetical protein